MSCGKRWGSMNPYDLHKTLINEYFLTTKSKAALLKRDTSRDKRDIDVIRENHQFLWDDDNKQELLSWEKRLAKKYYDKLFKEYCIGDLTRYKENKIGMRWRTEQEVISGRGQFTCGNRKCTEKEGLRTWEVNFGYVEHGTKKNALVKLRLCPNCSYKLNYQHKRKEVKRLKHSHRKIKEEGTSCMVTEIKETDKDETEEKMCSSEVKQVEDDIWKQSKLEDEEGGKSREEEFDEYLDQLFL